MLKLSHDSKVEFYKGQKNTFGLLPGRDGTCPGATHGIGGCLEYRPTGSMPVCYVYGCMRRFPCVKNVLEFNTTELKQASSFGRESQLTTMFAEFTTKIKNRHPNNYFRLHWAGDVFDTDYANALQLAMNKFDYINFWAYTRAFASVPILLLAPNLKLYLSLDPINLEHGMETYYQNQPNKNLKISYLSRVDDFQQLVSDPEIKLTPCPSDAGTIKGSGACAKCLNCPQGRDHVWFQTK